VNDRQFIEAIAQLLTKYRDQVREETLAEVRRKLIGSAPVQAPATRRRRGRPMGQLSQRARIENLLTDRPWLQLREITGAMPDVKPHGLQVLLSRLFADRKLQRRGVPGQYEYALAPVAVAAE
jgi:hypothetical protein